VDELISNEKEHQQTKEKIPLIHDALVLGIRDYFGKIGSKRLYSVCRGGLDFRAGV